METRETEEGFELFVDYRGANPITVAFQPQSKAPPEDLPSLILVRLLTGERTHLITQSQDWIWNIWVHPGIQEQAHDEDHVYELPFAAGASFIVSLGFDEPTGHTGPDRYAVDFPMPEGSPVHAARGGWVYSVREDSRSRRDGQENYIYIRHDDGTLGQYLHLQADGALVDPGQAVKAGDLIGLSGNTGRSTGPHLHFHVSTPDGSGEHAFRTFPVRFRTQDGPERLQQGRRYTRPE